MLTVLIPRPSRDVVLGVAISGASGAAGLLEPITGCLSVLLAFLSAHFFGRGFGRLAAGFASLGIAGVALVSSHAPLASGSFSRCAVTIAAAWLCAELVARRPRPGSTARLKDEPFAGQLRQRDQTLQSIGSLFPGHVWTALPNGDIEYLGPSLCEYTGIKKVPDCAAFRAAIHPDDLKANDRYWDAVRAGNDMAELEFRLKRIDGEYRWFLCRVKAIRNDSGRLLRWVGVSWDIHERKIAESLLRTEEETYRRIVDSVPACVCVGSPAGELLYVNKVGVAALGRPMEELVGKRWMDYIHPDDVQAARQQWEACIAARETVDIAVKMLQRDGVYRWQRLLAEPSRCQNGDVVNWYLIGTEIEETIKAQQALTASEREARDLLDRLPGRFAVRTEHDFDFVSQQILEETGTTLGGIQNLGFLSFIHPDDRNRVKERHLLSVREKSAHEIVMV